MFRTSSLIIGILLLGCLLPLNAQEVGINKTTAEITQISSESILRNWEERNFFDVQKEMNDYYAQNPEASGLKQWKRMEHYLEPRLYPSGKMFNIDAKNMYAYLKMKQQSASSEVSNRSQHGSWLFYGSTNIPNGSTGRVNNIEFHPTDPNILYLATASGGIWKTTNGGSSWTSISTHLPSMAIGDIAIDWVNDVIYVGTGDGHNGARPGLGILKSSDDGATWQFTDIQFSLTQSYYIDKILIDPSNPLRQFAVTNKGLLRTTNGWTDDNYPPAFFGIRVYDIEFKPNDPTQLILSLHAAIGTTPLRYSDDSGQSWSPVIDANLNSLMDTLTGKIHLAVTPDNPDRAYVLGAVGGVNTLIRGSSFGENNTWSVMTADIPALGAQDGYNMGLAVSPDDEDHVIVGKVNTRISYSGGASGTWVAPTVIAHPDVHAIEFRNNKVYHCNDGGLFISTDGGDHFTDHSQGMSPTEIYAIGATPQNLGLVYAGTQDNGTIKRSGAGSVLVSGGDGFSCAVNYQNSSIAYTSSQDGIIYKTTDGVNHNPIAVPEGGSGPFFTMLSLDPVDPDIVFLGQDSIHRSDNALIAGSFVNLGTAPDSGKVTEMVQGINNRNRFYYSSGVKLYRTNDALSTTGPANWTQINNELPGQWVSSVEVNSQDANTVYVCLHGYSAGSKVYRSTSSGDAGSWENISGSLPNVPVNCVKYHDNGNDGLYVGTDIGVFYRDNTLTDWIYFSNHLPVVRVNRLYIHEQSNLILAGTFGRGLWISATYTACPNTLTVSTNSGGELYFSASQSIEIESEFPASVDSEVKLAAGNFIDFNTDFHSGGGGFLNAMIGGCAEVYQQLTIPANQPPQQGTLTNPEVFLRTFHKPK